VPTGKANIEHANSVIYTANKDTIEVKCTQHTIIKGSKPAVLRIHLMTSPQMPATSKQRHGPEGVQR